MPAAPAVESGQRGDQSASPQQPLEGKDDLSALPCRLRHQPLQGSRPRPAPMAAKQPRPRHRSTPIGRLRATCPPDRTWSGFQVPPPGTSRVSHCSASEFRGGRTTSASCPPARAGLHRQVPHGHSQGALNLPGSEQRPCPPLPPPMEATASATAASGEPELGQQLSAGPGAQPRPDLSPVGLAIPSAAGRATGPDRAAGADPGQPPQGS